jgi:hypothetical protein
MGLGTGEKLTATTISPLTGGDTVVYVFEAEVCGNTIVGDYFPTVNNPFCVDANDDAFNDGSTVSSSVNSLYSPF